MADSKTANDWSTVRAEATAQLVQLKAQEAKTLQILANSSGAGRVGASARGALDQLRTQIAQTEATIRNATTQVELANSAPPGTLANPTTSVNPAPGNNNPGNNTDIPPVTSQGLPVFAEDGSIAQNIAINPETGDTFFTDQTTPNAQPRIATNTQGLPVFAEDGSVAQGIAINPETGETFFTGTQFPPSVEQTAPEIQRQLDAAAAAAGDSGERPADEGGGGTPVSVGVNEARTGGNLGRYIPFPEARDYRVRISLAPSADYLYKDPDIVGDRGNLLWPLIDTDGVLFPYLPQINVSYSASYSPTDLVHSNYKIFNYTGSAVESVQITGDFTAQDVIEANYVLAVIHFFKCVTKMFYGQDQQKGVPPPLVYLSGHGQYGFDNHPMVITNFSLNYPTDCDYINAGPYHATAAVFNSYKPPSFAYNPSQARLYNAKLQKGGIQAPPTFGVPSNNRSEITRVPSKIQLQISANPIVTRENISNNFSLKQYATGKLLQGSKNKSGGGIW